MKKLFQVGFLFCSMFLAQYGFTDEAVDSNNARMSNRNAMMNNDAMDNNTPRMSSRNAMMNNNDPAMNNNDPRAKAVQDEHADAPESVRNHIANANGQCPEDHAVCDQPTGDCWCMYCHYQPRYYTTQRCVEECVPCKKRCCRLVPKYYEVKRCRMVPEYYTETICRNEPEYYEVEETKTVQKYVCDQHCQYCPQYYWKHVCGDKKCTTPCPNGNNGSGNY